MKEIIKNCVKVSNEVKSDHILKLGGETFKTGGETSNLGGVSSKPEIKTKIKTQSLKENPL